MQIVYILLFLAALGWLVYSWRKKTALTIPIVAAVGTLVLNIFPVISYLLLLGALGWAGFTFYKKRDIKQIIMPAIGVAAALVLVLTMPSGGILSGGIIGGGNSSGGISTSASGRDFSSEKKIQEYFEKAFPEALFVQVAGKGNVNGVYEKQILKGYLVSIGETSGLTKYYVTADGRIFDDNVSNLLLLH